MSISWQRTHSTGERHQWVGKTQSKLWNDRYEEMVKYKRQKGDCNVPCQYKANKKLGMWVSQQRQMYKREKLSEERKSMLEKVGFKWEICRGREHRPFDDEVEVQGGSGVEIVEAHQYHDNGRRRGKRRPFDDEVEVQGGNGVVVAEYIPLILSNT
jgi:hypothetical protein